ncbi:hypothetical protein BDR07DRAFT_1378695 [Suillus spraguei]|nr:hypothetical protein BDR07DRAFT_1378695 [Suillus spraguei]
MTKAAASLRVVVKERRDGVESVSVSQIDSEQSKYILAGFSYYDVSPPGKVLQVNGVNWVPTNNVVDAAAGCRRPEIYAFTHLRIYCLYCIPFLETSAKNVTNVEHIHIFNQVSIPSSGDVCKECDETNSDTRSIHSATSTPASGAKLPTVTPGQSIQQPRCLLVMPNHQQ